MHNKYYVWILVALGLALVSLVLVMVIQDSYDSTPASPVMVNEKIKERKRTHQGDTIVPTEVDLMEEGSDIDADALEMSDTADELNGFEDIDFEEVKDSDVNL